MKKKEAAEYLGISEHALLLYASEGRVKVTYGSGRDKTPVADFNDDDLRALKEELTATAAKTLIHKGDPGQVVTRRAGAARPRDLMVRQLLEAATAIQSATRPGEKLLLTLDDCVQLSSLSKDYLGQALRDGRLKGTKLGRGWKVKRSDLEAFIKKL